MKIQFVKPEKPEPNFKSSVHRTGRIGFSIESAKAFGITTSNCLALGVNAEDPDDQNIYGMLVHTGSEEGYLIQKAGNYHSVKAALFFDARKIDYSNGDLSFDVSEKTIDGRKILVFKTNPRRPAKVRKAIKTS